MFISMATIAASINKIFMNQKTTMIFLAITFFCIVICDSASSRNRGEDSGRIYSAKDGVLMDSITYVGSVKMNDGIRATDAISNGDKIVDSNNPRTESPLNRSLSSPNCAIGSVRHWDGNKFNCFPAVKKDRSGRKKGFSSTRRRSEADRKKQNRLNDSEALAIE